MELASDQIQKDSYDLLIENLENKYPYIFNQIRKILYNEDRFKVLDKISLHLLDYTDISNFRIGRDDNGYTMKNYKNSRIGYYSTDENKRSNQFDSSVYCKLSGVSYYFGFAYAANN